jgi:hypothetical protein
VEFKLLEGTSDDLVRILSSSFGELERVQSYADGVYKLTTTKPEQRIPEIYKAAEKLGLHVTSIYVAEMTLEDVFIELVTREGDAS